MSTQEDRLKMVERHREAIDAVMELKTSEMAIQSINSLKEDQGEVCTLY